MIANTYLRVGNCSMLANNGFMRSEFYSKYKKKQEFFYLKLIKKKRESLGFLHLK
jgi:hypothetical protein